MHSLGDKLKGQLGVQFTREATLLGLVRRGELRQPDNRRPAGQHLSKQHGEEFVSLPRGEQDQIRRLARANQSADRLPSRRAFLLGPRGGRECQHQFVLVGIAAANGHRVVGEHVHRRQHSGIHHWEATPVVGNRYNHRYQ
jgi:hypothetical protein